MSTASVKYEYLAPDPHSSYRHLFVKGRRISARTLDGAYMCEEPMTIEEIAADRDLPVEAVREAIAYCESNPPELQSDLRQEAALIEAMGMNDPNYDGKPRRLSAAERARIAEL